LLIGLNSKTLWAIAMSRCAPYEETGGYKFTIWGIVKKQTPKKKGDAERL